MEGVIPGLPDDLALLCLAHLPRFDHPNLSRVCRRWRQIVTPPYFTKLSPLQTLRHNKGLAQEFILLLPINHRTRPFALMAASASDSIIRKGSLPRKMPILPEDHTCIAIGPFTLFLGGKGKRGSPSRHLYIFDAALQRWWNGARMRFPRSDGFAWGVIDGRLYVAGGVNDGYITKTEVYDIASDSWTILPDLPSRICVNRFFVYNGALYVKGILLDSLVLTSKLFYFVPSLCQWREDENMINTVLKNEKKKAMSLSKIISVREDHDQTLCEVEICGGRTPEDGLSLTITKLQPETSMWVTAFCMPYNTLCSDCFARRNKIYYCNVLSPTERDSMEDLVHRMILVYKEMRFPTAAGKVVVMDHSPNIGQDSATHIGVTHVDEAIKLVLDCPLFWDVAVINI